MTSNRVKPFYCGGQFGDWTSANCDRCTKGSHLQPENEWPKCELEATLVEAYVTDGLVTAEVAAKIGYTEHQGAYQWCCTEWEPTEEWKTEWKIKHQCEDKDNDIHRQS